jgi:chromate reductase
MDTLNGTQPSTPDTTNMQPTNGAAWSPEVQKTILALPGSLRRGSYNRLLLEAAAQCAPVGMSVVVYDDLASIPLFNEDLELETQGGPDGVRRLRQQIAAAHGVLIATPEYNHSIPGVLKNAIDWISRADEVLVGKPVSVLGATSGRWGTRLAQSTLRQVLYATQALVLPKPAMFVVEAERLFDPSGQLTDQPTRQSLAALLSEFGKWIDLVADVRR